MSGIGVEIVSIGLSGFDIENPSEPSRTQRDFVLIPLIAREILMILDQSSFSKTLWPIQRSSATP